MASKKQKFYVVWKGHEPGIYESWQECESQVKGFPKALYQSYRTREEAEEAYDHGPSAFRKKQQQSLSKATTSSLAPKSRALSVDAACSGNPGSMEYRAVWIDNGVEEFRMGPFRKGTNNIGEFLAIVHAAALFQQREDKATPIYTDSKTAMAWVRKKKANTKLTFGRANQRLKELVQRAESWLKINEIPNPIRKWNTKEWGEIPADFGRK